MISNRKYFLVRSRSFKTKIKEARTTILIYHSAARFGWGQNFDHSTCTSLELMCLRLLPEKDGLHKNNKHSIESPP